MGSLEKSIKDEVLANWLEEEFKNINTKYTYLAALRLFKKNLGIDDLGNYLKDKPNVIFDLKKFLTNLHQRLGG
jgi:hypothetical protein